MHFIAQMPGNVSVEKSIKYFGLFDDALVYSYVCRAVRYKIQCENKQELYRCNKRVFAEAKNHFIMHPKRKRKIERQDNKN